MAGESARESARRQLEKAERLQRSAALWERGADGEQATAAALDALPKDTWTVFHDIRWPGRKYANVDHVVVGPPGIFVVDSKNWTGSITITDNVLRQNGRSRETAVAGAAEAALAVAGLTPVVIPQHVQPVVCFVRDETLTGWARDVMVCSTANVVQMLATRPEVLPPHIVREACLQLDAMFRSATAPASYPSGPRQPQRPVSRLAPMMAARPPATRSRLRGRKKPSSGLIKPLLGLLLLVFLMGNPQVLTSVSQGIATLFVTQVVDTNLPAPQQSEPPGKRDTKRKPAARESATPTNR